MLLLEWRWWILPNLLFELRNDHCVFRYKYLARQGLVLLLELVIVWTDFFFLMPNSIKISTILVHHETKSEARVSFFCIRCPLLLFGQWSVNNDFFGSGIHIFRLNMKKGSYNPLLAWEYGHKKPSMSSIGFLACDLVYANIMNMP